MVGTGAREVWKNSLAQGNVSLSYINDMTSNLAVCWGNVLNPVIFLFFFLKKLFKHQIQILISTRAMNTDMSL